VKVIPLTKGQFAKVDDHRYEHIMNFRESWCAVFKKGIWYAMCIIDHNGYYMHHLILPLKEGFWVDHIDRDGLNNLDSNLRYATCVESARNRGAHKDSYSGLKGISRHDGKWRVRITADKGKSVFVGRFSRLEDAVEAYNEAAKKYHGEFAVLNSLDKASSRNVGLSNLEKEFVNGRKVIVGLEEFY
jgi:hypothetical protein